jgi:hypothetical protein
VPHELLVTDDTLVYVMDRENHRWQVFTTDGAFVSLQEHVSHPNRVALDADGTFHIAGGAGIEIWKRDGTKIGSWGEQGEAPGQFVAGSVHGAWMDTDGSLYTAEASRNNRLQNLSASGATADGGTPSAAAVLMSQIAGAAPLPARPVVVDQSKRYRLPAEGDLMEPQDLMTQELTWVLERPRLSF